MSAPIEQYINSQGQWSSLLILLREIALSTSMEENLKWGVPVYGFGKKNLVGIAAFKYHCALWFYQGALLEDAAGKLIKPQDDPAKAMRQWRFTSPDEVVEYAETIQDYMLQAIQNHLQGKEIKPEKQPEPEMPIVLKQLLDDHKNLAAAFLNLKPGRKKEFIQYIAQAKRIETQEARLKKIAQLLNEGDCTNSTMLANTIVSDL